MPDLETPADAPEAAPETVAEAAPDAPAGVSALVVCDGKVPAKDGRLILVAEVRGDDGSDVKTAYGAGAGYYVRGSDVDMGCPPERLMTLGVNLQQYGFAGFSPSSQAVNVGPAHPAYAAANFAYNLGARTIEIKGLSEAWKARLQPFLDAIDPAFGVAVSLT